MANPTGSNQTLVKIYEQLLNAIRVAVVDSALPDGAATLAEQQLQTALLTDIEVNQTNGTQQTQVVSPDGSILQLVKESDNYNNSQHGIGTFGVDDSSPTRKWRPFKTDTQGHQYNHLLDALNVLINPATADNQSTIITNTARTFSSGTSTRPSINNTSSTILAANTSRKYAIITNNNGFTAYLKLGTTAVVGEGIPLGPDERYEIKRDNLWTGSITAIKATAIAANLDVFEGT